jgi:hypothetical protein
MDPQQIESRMRLSKNIRLRFRIRRIGGSLGGGKPNNVIGGTGPSAGFD